MARSLRWVRIREPASGEVWGLIRWREGGKTDGLEVSARAGTGRWPGAGGEGVREGGRSGCGAFAEGGLNPVERESGKLVRQADWESGSRGWVEKGAIPGARGGLTGRVGARSDGRRDLPE